ncbi:MAG: class I tRNA ligase family protein [Candidatus Limnocylindrales bacterium]
MNRLRRPNPRAHHRDRAPDQDRHACRPDEAPTETPTDERTRVERYDPTAIEPRWQARWAELGLYDTDLSDTTRPKYYLLTMYPYPSGDLHIGHWYIVTPSDALARYRRMHGYNVFFPIGFDAFGLPAENAAIKSGGHPFTWTMSNIDNMRRQFTTMGATFSWKHEVVTADPAFYRWNQWIFLQFLARGLAYRQKSPVDWCPNDGTLAREQVEGRIGTAGAAARRSRSATWSSGTCARRTTPTSCCRFEGLDWPESIQVQQTNWIGRSEGARDRLRDRTVGPPCRWREAARVHDPTRHAVRCDVHGPRAGASARSVS